MRILPDDYSMDALVQRYIDATIVPLWDRRGSWEDHVLSWIRLRQGRSTFCLIRYEDLLSDPVAELSKAARILKIEPTPERIQQAIKLSSASHMRRFVSVDDLHLNGKLTLGENTADNGGARIALMSLQDLMAQMKQNPDNKIDGYSPNQRYFLGFARVWCENPRTSASGCADRSTFAEALARQRCRPEHSRIPTASGLLAVSSLVWAHAIGGFPYYDPRLLRMYRWGGLLSLSSLVFGQGAVLSRHCGRLPSKQKRAVSAVKHRHSPNQSHLLWEVEMAIPILDADIRLRRGLNRFGSIAHCLHGRDT